MSEGELLAAAQAGDGRAFAEICRRYGTIVEHRIRRHVHGPLLRKLDVADVVQEALLVAHQRLQSFELQGEGCLGAWLASIAELKAREAVRHHVAVEGRSIAREVGPGARPETGAFRGSSPTPSQGAIATEAGERIERALECLRPDYTAVLKLVVGDRLTLADAATAMGRSYEATKKLYARALAALSDRVSSGRILPAEAAPDSMEGATPGDLPDGLTPRGKVPRAP